MIRSFRMIDAEQVFRGDVSRRLPHDIQHRAFNRLKLLDAAESLEDLGRLPGNRLHTLGGGDRAGQHSISINMQWRICFVWRDGGAEHVEIVDYHR